MFDFSLHPSDRLKQQAHPLREEVRAVACSDEPVRVSAEDPLKGLKKQLVLFAGVEIADHVEGAPEVIATLKDFSTVTQGMG
jgi:hypothetical protein